MCARKLVCMCLALQNATQVAYLNYYKSSGSMSGGTVRLSLEVHVSQESGLFILAQHGAESKITLCT